MRAKKCYLQPTIDQRGGRRGTSIPSFKALHYVKTTRNALTLAINAERATRLMNITPGLPHLFSGLRLDLLNIISRHTLPHASLLHICPAITGILRHKDKPLAFHHAPLRVASRLIVIHRLNILQFLGAAFGRNRRSFLLARADCATR